MGADPRDPRHRSGARRARAPCRRRTVLAAALKTLEFDLVLAGVDTSDGVGGRRPGRRSRRWLGLPFLSYAAEDRARRGRRHGPRPTDQPDRLRRPRGADAGAHHRARRRSASRATRRSRGSWRARSKEIATPLARRPRPRSGDGRWRRRHDHGCSDTRRPPARGATRVVREAPDEAAAPDRRLPRRAEDHLMARLWVIGEPGPDGRGLAQLSDGGRDAGPDARRGERPRDVTGIVVGADPGRRRRGARRATCRA